jgi:outer membrane lipoprotein SlyB
MACVSRWVVVGVFAAWLLGIAPSHAAPPGRAAPAALFVDAFDVEQVPSLAPGTLLQFSVFASPGASATVLVEGVPRLVELREVQPGVYEGVHVIESGDRLRVDSTAVATVWRDGAVVRATLEESLLLDGAPPAPTASSARAPSPSPSPSRSPLPLPAPVPRALTLPPPLGFPAGVAAEGRLSCRDCARVESIRAVEVATGPAYAGSVAGSIAGALFGEEIGKAHERHVTGALGAIGSAVLGRPAQRAGSSRTLYDATLRLPNGTLRVRRYDAPPPFQVGQVIRLETASPAGDARSF